ncbi:MAG TPA: substrate-binding domain-containing protein [Pseudonocardiaceae bacterium]|nr:substrate-binding domain-containing protein [Pseudonocardiaceae bacterium]
MRVRIVAPILALATSVLLAASACSTGASGGSTTPSGSSGGADPGGLTASATAALQAKVDKFRAVPSFTAPGPSIDLSSLRGKSIFIVPETNNVFNNVNVAQMKTIATAAGITATVYDNQGTSAQWVQGIQTAISQHVSLIILANAPDPRALQPQLAAAKAAGIPVVVTHFYDDSAPKPPTCEGCAAGVTALETAPFNTAAELLADWVILQAKGNVDALIPIVGGVIPTPGMQSAIQGEFKQYCPKCTYKFINIPLSDFASGKLGNDIQASVSGDPKVNWIIDQLDSMEPATLTTINTAGRNGKINVVGYNGSTFAIKDVQGGSSPMVMDVGESAPWIGYATMDQAFRVLLGKPTVSESAPVRVFDSTNAAEAGTPPSLTEGYGDAYVNGFKQLWGMG